jgi:hypothetical protein
MSVQDLLAHSAAVLVELPRREIVRTDNAPLGDVAERIVFEAYGGVLSANSGKSYDLLDARERRVQVKARTIENNKPGAALFSIFRSFDFDVAVFLVLDRPAEIIHAIEVEVGTVQELATFRQRINGYTVPVRKLMSESILGLDVRNELQSAYGAL